MDPYGRSLSWSLVAVPQGTVTTASVATANGVSGTVATATSTPVITIVLGNIVPASVLATNSLGLVSGLASLNSGGRLILGTNIDNSSGNWIQITGLGGVSQVETATAAGTITADGNATVVVTGAGITGSPVTLSVPVQNGDTAATWAGKVRTAISGNGPITALYTVGGSGASVTLTRLTFAFNDGTLNISLDNGTCTGITTAATSANTTSGTPGFPSGIMDTTYGFDNAWNMRAAEGSGFAPTATPSGRILRPNLTWGFDGTSWLTGGGIEYNFDEAFTTGSHGGSYSIWLTPVGSGTRAKTFKFSGSDLGFHLVLGGVYFDTVGKGIAYKTGSNGRVGNSGAMTTGAVTVSNTSVTANSRIKVWLKTPGGTVGQAYVSTITAATSFVLTSTSGSDTSDWYYEISEITP